HERTRPSPPGSRGESCVQAPPPARARPHPPPRAPDPGRALRGDFSLFLPREPQQRQHRRLGVFVAAQDFFRLTLEVGKFHRSSSPPIILTDPKVGIMSAIISPVRILVRADMIAKHGGRTRTRYGLPVPSLTT